ncbi:MAG: hypothetical protein A2033_09005 [Bacteroidetes bacterium GWA2_31_9]|nr:MAG: hypothetical protein A2033_09005 [Bacteroidetes bacterium GWA2_31_9]
MKTLNHYLIILLVALFPTLLLGQYATNSVLSNGIWKKLKIKDEGIYKISFADLVSMGFSNPENIHIYGNGGIMLSEMNIDFRNDDLVENPIFIEKGADNIFNSGDYILFYGKGSVKWDYDYTKQRFVHTIHKFSDDSYYFITSNNVACNEISSTNGSSLISNKTVTTFNDFQFHEIENYNLIKSGSLWFGEHFNSDTTNLNLPFTFPNILSSYQVRLTSYLATRSSYPSSFTVNANGSLVQDITIIETNMSSYTAPYANTQLVTNNFPATSSSININFDYFPANATSEGWLNYLELNARRELRMAGSQMNFRDIESVGTGNISEFVIENADTILKVWDISNYLSPKNILYNITDSTIKFKANTDTLKQFVIFSNTNYLVPEFVGDVANQNLHALPQSDFIIVTHSDFINQANELADLHRNNDNMSVIVVTPEQIYNEFSSGSPDVSAIRDFVKMFYDRATDSSNKPKYLLLFGDGSYDNRTISATNTNYILTYQSASSLKPTESYATDDFYTLLDNNEGGVTGFEDIGVGRFPVRNITEAENVVNKIKIYMSNSSFGKWRNNVTFIADDEDANQHMNQSEALATKIDTTNPEFNVKKTYLDAYQQVTTPAGQSYPAVTAAILSSINQGTLLINYLGHGNNSGLAEELVIDLSDINSLNNHNKLFIMVTLTCLFNRFDDYNQYSAGEQLFLNPNGGTIALFSATRLTYSTPSFVLNDKLYNHFFSHDTIGGQLRLGDIFRLAKNDAGSLSNKRNVVLLGDPALKPAIPELNVVTTNVSCNSLNCTLDTIMALTNVTVSGIIKDNSDNIVNWINDTIEVIVFDKKESYSTLANDGGQPINYSEQKNKIFEGKANIVNGTFEFSFIVPEDISLDINKGKISYYFSTDNIDGNGYDNSFTIGGGINSSSPIDNTGPNIDLYINNESFISGDTVGKTSLLIAKIYDISGINILESGHNISGKLDNETIVLNNYFSLDFNSYQSGKINYIFDNLADGLHEFKLIVWDSHNNITEETISFFVKDSTSNAENINYDNTYFIIYPNPFNSSTTIEYTLSTQVKVKIELINMLGSKMAILDSEFKNSGKHVLNINKTELNLTSGIYYLSFDFGNKLFYKKLIVQ